MAVAPLGDGPLPNAGGYTRKSHATSIDRAYQSDFADLCGLVQRPSRAGGAGAGVGCYGRSVHRQPRQPAGRWWTRPTCVHCPPTARLDLAGAPERRARVARR